MKRVSFEVAKYIKKIGYPQDIWKYSWFYNEDGELLNISNTGYYEIPAPTYMEVWLQLWREKRKCIEIIFSEDEDGWTFMQNPSPCDCGLYQDPEDAIIAAIEYLVTNKLNK